MPQCIAGDRRGGGGVWESNPPTRVLAGRAGFEDQSRHQSRSTPGRQEATSLVFPGQLPQLIRNWEEGLL